MARYEKRSWVLVLIILAGIVVGSFIGHLCRDIPYLSLLNYGKDFVIGNSDGGTLRIDIGMLVLDFALTIKLTIAGILGVVFSILVYKKL